jgi:hypothetical protein
VHCCCLRCTSARVQFLLVLVILLLPFVFSKYVVCFKYVIFDVRRTTETRQIDGVLVIC